MMMVRNILIVEDEIITGMGLGAALESAGLKTALALSAEEAFGCIENKKPDLALIDINLGDCCTNGIDTARGIRDRFGIPVIFMTGYTDAAIRKHAAAVDCLGFLVKPVSLKSIIDIMHSCQEMERK